MECKWKSLNLMRNYKRKLHNLPIKFGAYLIRMWKDFKRLFIILESYDIKSNFLCNLNKFCNIQLR